MTSRATNRTTRAHCAQGSETTRRAIIVVPGIPPSVNHYVKHTRGGRHYVSKEAKLFKHAIAVMAHGRVEAERYEVTIDLYLGHGDRGDIDNFLKVPLDGLTEAGVIHSDAAVDRLLIEKHRDRINPRTAITVTAFTDAEQKYKRLRDALELAAARLQLAFDTDNAIACDVWAKEAREALENADC